MTIPVPEVLDGIASEPERLLARARAGDTDAFGELCLALKPRLVRHAVFLCGDCSQGEDLAQEALVESWKSLARYDGKCQFFTWVCAILHNRFRNSVRRSRVLSLLGFGRHSPEMQRLAESRPDHNPGPDESVQNQEQAAVLWNCVRKLPLKQQQVIYLRFFVDDSIGSIAAALGCSAGTVKSRLFYALDKLRGMPDLRQDQNAGT
jgi:RNA polymerase sigma-70 factor (ECF subfamily)